MKRAAITIIYEGLHHLKHNGFSQFMIDNFDTWIVVEGHARPGGTTRWCRHINVPYQSQDGTVEYMRELAVENDNVLFYTHHKYYLSKDEQFNKAIELLKTRHSECYLWQVDVDEQWRLEDIEASERQLSSSFANVANCQFNHYVKMDVIALGDWGSARVNRLWKWRGDDFLSHEPAVMRSQSPLVLELPGKFEHYSMVFEKDVKMKSKYYRGNEMVYPLWKRLDSQTFPCHISVLFGKNNRVGSSNTYLHKIELPCVSVTNQESQNAKIAC